MYIINLEFLVLSYRKCLVTMTGKNNFNETIIYY